MKAMALFWKIKWANGHLEFLKEQQVFLNDIFNPNFGAETEVSGKQTIKMGGRADKLAEKKLNYAG